MVRLFLFGTIRTESAIQVMTRQVSQNLTWRIEQTVVIL